jgi:hypothetical protein
MGELPTREEFSRLTVEEKRHVLKRAEFLVKPLDEKRKIIAELEKAEKTGVMEAVGRGFGQGLTFNTLDEMMGGVRGALRAWESGDDLKKAISEETEIARRGFRKSERERPIATGVGQVAGAVLPTALAPASAIPRTVLGRVGAGAAGGALAGAGKAEQGVGTEEFKHHVKTGALTGGVAQGGFNLGKLVIGKTGKATAGVLGAISQSVPKAIKGAALAAVPGPLKAGFNKTIKLMENGDLPPEQSGRLMRGLRSGGAGLASAYMDLINEDVEFARQVQGEKKGLSSIIPDRKKNDLEERIRSDLFNHPIPKSLEKSTASGRAQSFMDSLIGADKIGLDPGEKPKGGQPSKFDEDLVAILPLFGGITKKITKLDLAKRKELLEKKGKNLSGIDAERLRILEKAEMSPERKQKLIDRINEGIEGKSGSSKIKKRKETYVDRIRNKEITNDFHAIVWRDAKKSHDIPWDKPPVNGVMAPDVPTGTGDMFSWTDTRYGVTKDYLKKYADKIKSISTRSDLIAHDDYAKLIPKDAVVKIHVPAAYDRMGKIMEPGAPSLLRRLKAIDRLRKKGKKVEIVFDVPQENGQTVPGAWRGMMFVKNFAKDKGIDIKGIRTRRNFIDVTGEKGKKIRKILGNEYFEGSSTKTPGRKDDD